MRVTHEERPKPTAQKWTSEIDNPEYHTILCQASKVDIDQGTNKIYDLKRMGYEEMPREGDFDTGVPDTVYMRKPMADVNKDRAKRREVYEKVLYGKLSGEKKDSHQGSTGIYQINDDSRDDFTAEVTGALKAAVNK